MSGRRARSPVREPEIVLNLWAFADIEGYVRRIAGRAYAAEGSDDEKYELLRSLSRCDFLTARSTPVPQSFSVVDGNGNRDVAVAHAFYIHLPDAHRRLFLELIERLEREAATPGGLPAGEIEARLLTPSERPLTLTTIVLELGDEFVPLDGGWYTDDPCEDM